MALWFKLHHVSRYGSSPSTWVVLILVASSVQQNTAPPPPQQKQATSPRPTSTSAAGAAQKQACQANRESEDGCCKMAAKPKVLAAARQRRACELHSSREEGRQDKQLGSTWWISFLVQACSGRQESMLQVVRWDKFTVFAWTVPDRRCLSLHGCFCILCSFQLRPLSPRRFPSRACCRNEPNLVSVLAYPYPIYPARRLR